jgi:transcriptional regulator NrdR family protein
MEWSPVDLSCPSCGETVDATFDAVLADGGDRIRGRDFACRGCGDEFEVYYL